MDIQKPITVLLSQIDRALLLHALRGQLAYTHIQVREERGRHVGRYAFPQAPEEPDAHHSKVNPYLSAYSLDLEHPDHQLFSISQIWKQARERNGIVDADLLMPVRMEQYFSPSDLAHLSATSAADFTEDGINPKKFMRAEAVKVASILKRQQFKDAYFLPIPASEDMRTLTDIFYLIYDETRIAPRIKNGIDAYLAKLEKVGD